MNWLADARSRNDTAGGLVALVGLGFRAVDWLIEWLLDESAHRRSSRADGVSAGR